MSSQKPKIQLKVIERQLLDRDREVLGSLLLCRYFTTKQIQRRHFADLPSQRATVVAANRTVNRLKDWGLIEHLQRRVGGVRAGSASFVWTLTDSGFRILHPNQARKRLYEPSLAFLEHTLAVAETYLQITEICRDDCLDFVKVEFEPKCWRGYTDIDSKPATLKPDLFAVTASGDYEDSWFIEVDLATEAPSKVIDKCRRYAHYYRSGAEQKKTGVFPFVVWLVPSQSRKDSLQRSISGCKDLSPKNIFTVITPEQFSTLITQGGEPP